MKDFSIRHRFTVHLLSLFPQILLVALCNSRAMGETDENSDIDLFIIAKKNNLWTVRFIVTALTSLLGVRRKNTHGLTKGSPEYIKKTKDRFCLSFFITEEAMNFDVIRLQPNDPYLDKWILTLIPLVNKNHVYERFIKENSDNAPLSSGVVGDRGVQGKKENLIFGDNLTPQLKSEYLPPLTGGHGSNYSLSSLEGLIKKLWLPKTLSTYEKLEKPWGVIISDTMLKFHDNDQRKAYRDK